VLTSTSIASHFTPGTHGSTFGGNALACAVGCYVIDRVTGSDILEHVNLMSAFIKDSVMKLNEKYNVFTTVRGQGLLLGLVLNGKYAGKSAQLQKLCFKHKLLTLTAHSDVLRLAPALNIKKRTVNEAMRLLDKALKDFVSENQ